MLTKDDCDSLQSDEMKNLTYLKKTPNLLHRDDPLYFAENAAEQVCKVFFEK
jgi:hypothetical protein